MPKQIIRRSILVHLIPKLKLIIRRIYFTLIEHKIRRLCPEIPHDLRNDKTYLKTKRQIRSQLYEKEKRDSRIWPSLLNPENGKQILHHHNAHHGISLIIPSRYFRRRRNFS